MSTTEAKPAPKIDMSCRHCHERRATSWRELCHPCYGTKRIRALYPPRRSQRQGSGLVRPILVATYTPTTAKPGTPEKMFVLAERLLNQQPLFHPEDATHERQD